jgi:hypothetical protein
MKEMTMEPRFDHADSKTSGIAPVTRRQFVQTVGAGAAVASLPAITLAKGETKPKPESLVKMLHASLTPEQKKQVAFDWNHLDPRTGGKGPLRLHVSNNWHITKQTVASDFYTKDQQEMIEAIFFGLYDADWHDRIKKQLKDDAGGYGKQQNIAIFGEPGTGKFEFVMTGRHLTVRCDGDSNDHFSFGGPIFYGHAAQGFNEKADHPGNVFWHQALKANSLYEMLDGKQREQALLPKAPGERLVHFQGKEGKFPGVAVADLAADQKKVVQDALSLLVEPYRASDRAEALKALKAQGGLDKCSIAFYKSGDIGKDGVWDNWRLEGPAFVWHWRGAPHVHVWVNVADDPKAKITARG